MNWRFLPFVIFLFFTMFGFSVLAEDDQDDGDVGEQSVIHDDSAEDDDDDDEGAIVIDGDDDDVKTEISTGRSTSDAGCSCPKEGNWKVQNLEGWMNCTGPFDIKRKLGEVKDKGTIWILEEECDNAFGEADRKKDEDVLMEREETCQYKGRINGEEDGVKMVIDIIWDLTGDDFIEGEMYSKPSLQGMLCEFFRPFEMRFDDEIPEKDYDKRKKKMEKKLEKFRKTAGR